MCVLGIGGSALGAWALDCAMRGPHPVQAAFSTKNPKLVILDNVDPSLIGAALESMNPKKTLAVVIAKSGATAETMATFLIVESWLRAAMGKKTAQRIIAVTSKGHGDLATLAARRHTRPSISRRTSADGSACSPPWDWFLRRWQGSIFGNSLAARPR